MEGGGWRVKGKGWWRVEGKGAGWRVKGEGEGPRCLWEALAHRGALQLVGWVCEGDDRPLLLQIPDDRLAAMRRGGEDVKDLVIPCDAGDVSRRACRALTRRVGCRGCGIAQVGDEHLWVGVGVRVRVRGER